MIRRLRLLMALLFAASTVGQAQQILDLESYLLAVEQTYPALRAASYEPDLAEAEIRNALGRFDPDLRVEYEYKDKGGTDKLNYLDGSLQLPLNMMFGPKLKAEYRRGIGSQIDPENVTALPGEASLGVALPLLQGIFTDKRRTDLAKAYQRPEIAQAQYRIERNTLLRTAGWAYWDWSEAEAALAIADTLLQLAELRASQIAAQVRAGERAAIDSVEIIQEVYRRQGVRFDALRKAEQARVKAAVYLWSGDGVPRALTESPLPPPQQLESAPSAQQATEQARTQRPEVTRLTVMQRMARLDSALSREFLRPFIELEAGLTSYDVSTIGTTDYKVGLTISQPLLFRSASAGAQVADINVQRADLSQLLVQRVVEADALNALVAFSRAADRISAAEAEVDLARTMVEAERQKLIAGDSNLLQINLRERFYAEALLRLLAARADHARARIGLLWATGTI